eukprot:TRINITY_DN75280_c0_g1_i1.p1 TRINITY_DN75280_c0_g1~~TRINITY_DN75280_c0_g1_i1.p1  ORF type:complete len:1075 (-),score=172.59 TRINITY_DN75280_c0_g1_i1:54-3278(-)
MTVASITQTLPPLPSCFIPPRDTQELLASSPGCQRVGATPIERVDNVDLSQWRAECDAELRHAFAPLGKLLGRPQLASTPAAAPISPAPRHGASRAVISTVLSQASRPATTRTQVCVARQAPSTTESGMSTAPPSTACLAKPPIIAGRRNGGAPTAAGHTDFGPRSVYGPPTCTTYSTSNAKSAGVTAVSPLFAAAAASVQSSTSAASAPPDPTFVRRTLPRSGDASAVCAAAATLTSVSPPQAPSLLPSASLSAKPATTSRSLSRGGRPNGGGVGTGTRQPPLLPDDRVMMSEAVNFCFDLRAHAICRGNIANLMAARDECNLELARRQRRRHIEAGQEHRRLGTSWRVRRKRHFGHSECGGVSMSSDVGSRNTGSAKVNAAVDNSEDGSSSDTPSVDGRDGEGGSYHRSQQPGEADKHDDSGIEEDPKQFPKENRVKAIIRGRVENRRRQALLRVKRQDLRRTAVQELPESERVDMRKAFDYFADESGDLPHYELLRCLCELGLAGRNLSERSFIECVCSKLYGEFAREGRDDSHPLTTSALGTLPSRTSVVAAPRMPRRSSVYFGRAAPGGRHGSVTKKPQLMFKPVRCFGGKQTSQFEIPSTALMITFEDFCSEVVPACKNLLARIREDKHFVELCKARPSGTDTTIRLAELRHLAVELLGQDLDIVNDAIDVANCDSRDFLFLNEAHEVLAVAETNTERRRRSDERKLKEKVGMSDEMFYRCRHQLMELEQTFKLFDFDASSELERSEVLQLLRHEGLQPFHIEHCSLIEQILNVADVNDDGVVTFCEFVLMMEELRKQLRQKQRTSLRLVFLRFAQLSTPGDCGFIKHKDLVHALVAAGISLPTEQDNAVVLRVLEENDTGAAVTFDEFEDLFQWIREALAAREVRLLTEECMKLGIDLALMGQFMQSFDMLDADGSGKLDVNEVKTALAALLQREPSHDEMLYFYNQVRLDMSQDICAAEFLRLMNSPEIQKILEAKPPARFTLSDVPVDKLREILRMFALPDACTTHFGKVDVEETVAVYLGVKADQDLSEILWPSKGFGSLTSGKSVRRLMQFARRKAEEERFPP